MQPEKYVVKPRANPDNLKYGGGTVMWMWLYRRLDLFRIYKHSRKEELSEFFSSHIQCLVCG